MLLKILMPVDQNGGRMIRQLKKVLASQSSLSQVINEFTNIFQNFNYCIDLLFTNQQNLITDSGIHPLFNSNCHHQIIYGKFNLNIFGPLPYERHIWYSKHAKADMISKAIHSF